MGLEPGIVSIFGLINNHEKNIHVYFDRAILDEKTMTFHPNVNTRTIFVASKDVLKFVKEMGYDFQIIDLESFD